MRKGYYRFSIQRIKRILISSFMCGFMLFLLHPFFAHADDRKSTIKPEISYLIATPGEVSIEKVISGDEDFQFKRVKKNIPNFGIEKNEVWLKVEALIPDLSKEIFLEVAFPTLDTVDFYQVGRVENIHYRSGDHFKFSQRPFNYRNFLFPIDQNQINGNRLSVYLRINSSGSILVPIKIDELKNFQVAFQLDNMIYGIYYGIMIVMMLYNFFLALSTNNKSYFFYIAIIFANLITISSLNGHAAQYIWGDFPWWTNYVIIFGIGLWILSTNLFAFSFLKLSGIKSIPRTNFYILGIIGFLLLSSIFYIPYRHTIYPSNLLLIVNCLSLFFSGLYFMKKKVKQSGIFTLAWFMYLLGVSLYSLRNLGALPINTLTTNVLEFGSVAEVVLLSLALGRRYKDLETEKNEEQQRTLAALNEKQALIENQNLTLEDKIRERTFQLEQKQEQVSLQNEELQAQQEILAQQNRKLNQAKSIIEEQNLRLKVNNEELERKVKDRTAKLITSNSQLAANLQSLEQYAHVTAHNLRGPIARLHGLINLIGLENKISDPHLLDVISKLKESVLELDLVVHDMNAILVLQNQTELPKDIIFLENSMIRAKNLLKKEIAEKDATISYNFTACQSIYSHQDFINSIFYSLLSNAIKYSHPNRTPIISVNCDTQGLNNQLLLTFQDNGIGINLSKYGNKIFDMYARFHDHVGGKGLGLFIVKTQLEKLGGKIRVESVVGEGTTFKILIPNYQ
ncbi:MAG: hypothetical protein LAT68_02105 [Cyclobacteriaceae bacterium]|nr:hypothetical protein [Cyclobacteriaceae bacterium]MCH8515097.1 hypothetical protein [Cyclobacteriaceae bacterium]